MIRMQMGFADRDVTYKQPNAADVDRNKYTVDKDVM
jgi:hypothetical protein